jgi:NADH dehydrogenase
MNLEGKTITVFGGTGFLGRHIIWALAKTGATIRVATRSPCHAYFLRPAGDVAQVVPVFCDIRNDDSVASVLKGANYAINLVGILAESGRNTFYRLHVEAAERVAKACRANNLDLLVHVSTLGASNDAPSKYAKSKAQGESKVIHAFSRSVILRPSVVFGPEDNFFNMFAAMARISPFLPLIGGGHTKFQPVYVGDIAEAVHNILIDPTPEKYDGQIFELGGPKTYTFRELLEVMKDCTQQNVCLAPLPIPLAKLMGFFASILPGKPLTVDKVRTLQKDSVIDPGTPGLAKLGVEPTGLDAILPTYLAQYRPGGRFAQKKQAS